MDGNALPPITGGFVAASWSSALRTPGSGGPVQRANFLLVSHRKVGAQSHGPKADHEKAAPGAGLFDEFT
jgi:hypothetical protein